MKKVIAKRLKGAVFLKHSVSKSYTRHEAAITTLVHVRALHAAADISIP